MNGSILVGEPVRFRTNTGHDVRGQVVQRICERRQPVILLIEQANGLRCFRFEEEVTRLEAAALPAGA